MSLSVAGRFKAVLLQTSNLLFQEIIRLVQIGASDLEIEAIELVIMAIRGLKDELIIDAHLQKCSLTIWNEIARKNEDFFKSNLGALFNLPATELAQVSHLFTGKDANGELLISKTTRDQVWANLGALVRLSILYIHETREPGISDGQNVYYKEYLPHLDIWEAIADWKTAAAAGEIDVKWNIDTSKLAFK